MSSKILPYLRNNSKGEQIPLARTQFYYPVLRQNKSSQFPNAIVRERRRRRSANKNMLQNKTLLQTKIRFIPPANKNRGITVKNWKIQRNRRLARSTPDDSALISPFSQIQVNSANWDKGNSIVTFTIQFPHSFILKSSHSQVEKANRFGIERQ